jgi:glutathione peroxidase
MIKLALFVAAILFTTNLFAADEKKDKTVYDFSVKDIDGKPVDLSQYKGKVLLIVNVASKCGYTPQYKNLEAVYEKYKDKGFEILAFPANEFKQQEPGSNAEIKEFCTSTYHTQFPLFSKIVVKGDGQAPLYQYLTSTDANATTAGDIKWNFTKFLVDKDGKIVARFEPKVKPDDKEVTAAIDAEIAKAK